MSDIEEVAGQDMLPGQWPEPIITADIFIKRSLDEALSQLEYFTAALFSKDEGDESPEAKTSRLRRANMHCFSYLLDAVIADVLIEIQGYSRTWADSMAEALNNKLEWGDYYPEQLWHWATERGLDPEEITEKAKAKFAEKEAS
ncbi:hypothetical protein PP639_gp086 [Arthrobacter phage Seahorse]|uniref:Uncharacterized protein n=1 Tax=Arthrobacter phage Seahorse TaxID=2419611 RepID=A0A3G3M5B3_9CAUD|nr:hypothetical protein PP639_gp086 [Arthrobacter phage Seahorse]AYR01586.1 hypothetical protein PBI_SEAHORSE_86 [Arthrobacter phage Seahorse]